MLGGGCEGVAWDSRASEVREYQYPSGTEQVAGAQLASHAATFNHEPHRLELMLLCTPDALQFSRGRGRTVLC